MTVDSIGLIAWQPTPAEFGPNVVTVRVTNARGLSIDQSFTVEVVSQGSTLPPSITSTPSPSATVGRTYAYNAAAEDPDGGAFFWSLVTAPAGMSIDPRTGAIRWVPTIDQLGTSSVVIQAENAQMAATTQAFAITVRSVNLPPTITSEPPTQAAKGGPYAYAVAAFDAQGDPLFYSLATAPAGMTIDRATGLVSWTPSASEVGTQLVSIRVDDGQGDEATQDFQVVVSPTPLALPPTITSAPRLGATTGAAYGYAVQATDTQGGAIAYLLLQAPAGMTIDRTTGLVSWTPSASEVGLQQVTVAAVDPLGLGGTQHFAILVKPEIPPTIVSSPVASVVAGQHYGYDLLVANPNGGPLSYAVVNGPAGLAIDPAGRVTWSPQASNIGINPVVLSVTDAQGTKVTQAYNLTVSADTTAPVVLLSASTTRVKVGSDVMFHIASSDNVGVRAIHAHCRRDRAGRSTPTSTRRSP